MIKECIVCGKEFEAKRSDAKYCNKKCRQNYSIRNKRNSFAKKICIVCGKEFEGHNNSITCSEDCKDEYLQKMNLARGIGDWEGEENDF